MSSENKYWAHVMLAPTITITVHPDDVIPAVCKVLRLTEDEVKGPRRFPELIDARAIISHYVVHVLGQKYAYVGRMVGNRNHSTILNLCRNHLVWMENNKPYRDKYAASVAEIERLLR